jgi:hypothetical protein
MSLTVVCIAVVAVDALNINPVVLIEDATDERDVDGFTGVDEAALATAVELVKVFARVTERDATEGEVAGLKVLVDGEDAD